MALKFPLRSSSNRMTDPLAARCCRYSIKIWNRSRIIQRKSEVHIALSNSLVQSVFVSVANIKAAMPNMDATAEAVMTDNKEYFCIKVPPFIWKWVNLSSGTWGSPEYVHQFFPGSSVPGVVVLCGNCFWTEMQLPMPVYRLAELYSG